jgi:basic membrane lipoprotein Med (substrate-binding protein (PBP1-ABC) superfamily)
MAMILPGPVEDADFNALGYLALQEIHKGNGLPVSHSERVAVADAERVAREYIGSGYTIIAFHGGQYLAMTQKLAPQFPEVTFIIVSQGRGLPPNVWNITRRFYQGFYPLGALAALTTKSNKIGYVSGIRLPEFVSSLNAVHFALKDLNPKAELRYSFVGDQNDPLKARQATEALLGGGADVIVSQVNLGFSGVIEAARAAQRPVLVTSFYTDKYDAAPQVYAASLLLDFTTAYRAIVMAILRGQRGGDYEMRPGQAMKLSPIRNVSPEVVARVEAVYREVVAGKQVPDILDKIVVP